ncbi:MAG: beta-galactosidase [candidate division FCPU426 bacterium]
MNFGSAWYPEHWPESRWPEDLRLMKEARMDVVRVAEFAWSTMEPEEGKYDFGWLDRAIALAAEYGIKTVLGTPTAAPPAWLTQKYPDTLKVEPNGQKTQHGNRCHFNPWSKTYLKHCARITEVMAKRYGKNPHVIGWQFDNEYSTMSHDPETRAAFQAFLKARFKTLKALNTSLCGAYWSQDYSDWTQIPLPQGHHNPGLSLEFQRFFTHTYVNYQQNQLKALRKYAEPRQWCTHNFMGWFSAFDHYGVTADLDLASWDSYWAAGTPDPAVEGLVHDLTRGFKRKNFWLMETQPNTVNWAEINTMLEPGRLRLRNLQAVAHGADAILYWQWRNALGGQEQLHGSVIGHDGKPRPAYTEIMRLGKDLEAAGEALSGEPSRHSIALLNSYDARWVLGFKPMHKDFDYLRLFQDHAAPYFKMGLGTDVIDSMQPLDGYKLVVVPALYVMDPAVAEKLGAFVRSGGHVLLTPRTGFMAPDARMFEALPQGPLAEFSGVEVEDTYPLLEGAQVVSKDFKGRCKIWGERLRVNAKDAEVWASFGKGCGWLEGRPAVVSRKLGKGRITTLAGWFEAPLLESLSKKAAALAGIKALVTPPAGVEIMVRPGKKGDCLFVLNHSDKAAFVTLPRAKELFSGKTMGGKATLPAREVWLLELSK